ncbi:unnamed protein product, partial [Mesorhabditis spiculigera]
MPINGVCPPCPPPPPCPPDPKCTVLNTSRGSQKKTQPSSKSDEDDDVFGAIGGDLYKRSAISVKGEFRRSPGMLFRSHRSTAFRLIEKDCPAGEMKRLMARSMIPSSSRSKQRIISAFRMAIGHEVGVVCSEHAFSLHLTTTRFCRLTMDGVTCVAFRDLRK